MDYGSPWTQLGEWNLQGCGQVSSVGLVLDPIDVAGVFLLPFTFYHKLGRYIIRSVHNKVGIKEADSQPLKRRVPKWLDRGTPCLSIHGQRGNIQYLFADQKRLFLSLRLLSLSPFSSSSCYLFLSQEWPTPSQDNLAFTTFQYSCCTFLV